MGEMEEKMAARLREDGGAGLATNAVPGTDGGSQPTPEGPPAGAQNTDTSGGRTPDTIPYARFKEVNDAYSELKDLKPLLDYGYDSDSLGRLAAFDAWYQSDPIGAWTAMADNLDLPQGVKDAIAAHMQQTAPPGTAEGESSATAGSDSALSEEDRKRLEYVDQMREREAEAARNAQLDRVLSHWSKLDEKDGIETPERLKLNMVSAMGSSGQRFDTIEELVDAARGQILDYRSSVLGGAVRTGRTGTPLAVPGSASLPTGPVKFADIREASKAAEAAIQRGELPQ